MSRQRLSKRRHRIARDFKRFQLHVLEHFPKVFPVQNLSHQRLVPTHIPQHRPERQRHVRIFVPSRDRLQNLRVLAQILHHDVVSPHRRAHDAIKNRRRVLPRLERQMRQVRDDLRHQSARIRLHHERLARLLRRRIAAQQQRSHLSKVLAHALHILGARAIDAQALEGGVRLRDELFGRADLFAEHRDVRATREALCGRRVSSAPAGASQSAAVPCDRVC